MIKYGIYFLFLLILPAYAANDGCSNPAEYTIDRRCYVTNAMKSQAPYNSVVKLIDNEERYCSGTIVDFGEEQYIVTAYHCALGLDSDVIQQKIYAVTPNGDRITAHYHSGGGHEKGKDWAFYRIDNLLTPFVKRAGVKWRSVKNINNMPVWFIAYGGLKIMSDTEIKDFKARYIKYLRSRRKGLTEENGMRQDGILMKGSLGTDFLMAMGEGYYTNLLEDMDNMKISVCTMPRSYCQGWYGASGGGFFDRNDNMIGVLSAGVPMIGGKFHAWIDDPDIPTKTPDKGVFQPTAAPSFLNKL